MLSNITGKY